MHEPHGSAEPHPAIYFDPYTDSLAPLHTHVSDFGPLAQHVPATVSQEGATALQRMPIDVACALCQALAHSAALRIDASLTGRIMQRPDAAQLGAAAAAAFDVAACQAALEQSGRLHIRVDAPDHIVQRTCAALPSLQPAADVALDMACLVGEPARRAMARAAQVLARVREVPRASISCMRLHPHDTRGMVDGSAKKQDPAEILDDAYWHAVAALLCSTASTLQRLSLCEHGGVRSLALTEGSEHGLSAQLAGRSFAQLTSLVLYGARPVRRHMWLLGELCTAEPLPPLRQLCLSAVPLDYDPVRRHGGSSYAVKPHWRSVLQHSSHLTQLHIECGEGISVNHLGLAQLSSLRDLAIETVNRDTSFGFQELTVLTHLRLQRLAVHNIDCSRERAGLWDGMDDYDSRGTPQFRHHASDRRHTWGGTRPDGHTRWPPVPPEDSSLDDAADASWRAFLAQLERWPALQQLRLTHCNIDGRQTALLAACMQAGALAQLTALDLHQNRSARFPMPELGQKFLCAGVRIELLALALAHTPELRELDLGGNNWHGGALRALAGALPHLPHLTRLVLDGASPSSCDADALVDVLARLPQLRLLVWHEAAGAQHDSVQAITQREELEVTAHLRHQVDNPISLREDMCSDWDDM